MTEVRYTDIGAGITTIDTGFVRPGLAASHLICEGEQAAFVDVGTSHAVPRLLETLRQKQISRQHVRYIIVTHIHLDHAGGTGALLQHLPNATVVVHRRGVRHLQDPSYLIAGSTAVYGEEMMRKLFGDIVPVPKSRVLTATHELRLDLNGRPLLCLETPGHARHHICLVDDLSQGVFTGDTFGTSYREFDTEKGPLIFPTSSPIHFEPELLHQSIELLMSYQPRRMYLTHFGAVSDVKRLADELHESIDRLVQLTQDVPRHSKSRFQDLYGCMETLYYSWIQAHGCSLPGEQIRDLLAPDLKVNVQGLEVWMDRHKHSQTAP